MIEALEVHLCARTGLEPKWLPITSSFSTHRPSIYLWLSLSSLLCIDLPTYLCVHAISLHPAGQLQAFRRNGHGPSGPHDPDTSSPLSHLSSSDRVSFFISPHSFIFSLSFSRLSSLSVPLRPDVPPDVPLDAAGFPAGHPAPRSTIYMRRGLPHVYVYIYMYIYKI